MTDKEYEQKKRECWIECAFGDCNLGDASTPVTVIDTCKQVFDWAFDRAYALGKGVGKKGKPLDTYLTDEDKENVRAEYKAMAKANLDFLPEKETAVLEGWVARDNDGFISLFSYCPDRVIKDDLGFWGREDGLQEIDLPKDSFPSMTWQSEPKKVKITIEEI